MVVEGLPICKHQRQAGNAAAVWSIHVLTTDNMAQDDNAVQAGLCDQCVMTTTIKLVFSYLSPLEMLCSVDYTQGEVTSHLWSQCDCHFVGQHVVLLQLNGEDLSRYSNKIESVGLRKCPYYPYLIQKVTSTDVRTTNISQSLPPQNGGKQLI